MKKKTEKYEKCPFMGSMKENDQTCACGGRRIFFELSF
jgi:hypothetical protein